MGMEVADLFASLGLKPKSAEWAQGDRLISGVKRGLEAFVGFEAVRGVIDAVDSVVQLGTKLDITKQKTGLAVEALQEYGDIARRNGSDIDSFAHGVAKLAHGLDEGFVKGAGPAIEALQRLHINVSSFKTLSMDDKIKAIAAALNKLPDGATKTALAMDLFGRSGMELIPTLNKIAEEGDGARAAFRELGGEISGDQAKALHDLDDSVIDVKTALGGLKTQVVVALLPVLKEMIAGVLAWVKANREVIASGIHAVVEGLVAVFGFLGDVMGVVVNVIAFLNEHATLASAIFLALKIVLAAVAIEAALAWLAVMGPALLVVAAITAIVLVVQDLISSIVDGQGVFASVFHAIGGFLRASWNSFKDFARRIKGFFVDIGHDIVQAFRDAFDWIIDKARAVGDALADLPIIKQLGDFGRWIVGGTGEEGIDKVETAPARTVPGAGATNTTNVTAPVSIQINASNANAQEVVDIAKQQIKEHHDKTWRDAHAATGGSEEGEQ